MLKRSCSRFLLPLRVRIDGMGPGASPDPVPTFYAMTIKTTRRFWARPSRVLLGATGASGP
jgi:hypothetical protein